MVCRFDHCVCVCLCFFFPVYFAFYAEGRHRHHVDFPMRPVHGIHTKQTTLLIVQAGNQGVHCQKTEEHRVSAAFARLLLKIKCVRRVLLSETNSLPPRVRIGRVQLRGLRMVRLFSRPTQLFLGRRIGIPVFLKTAQFLLKNGLGAVFIQKTSQFLCS